MGGPYMLRLSVWGPDTYS